MPHPIRESIWQESEKKGKSKEAKRDPVPDRPVGRKKDPRLLWKKIASPLEGKKRKKTNELGGESRKKGVIAHRNRKPTTSKRSQHRLVPGGGTLGQGWEGLCSGRKGDSTVPTRGEKGFFPFCETKGKENGKKSGKKKR